MDEIYGNLENYTEEASIAELQNENKELKCKLEEYAANLERLQRDFDKLTSEHKKLELNYSSLLKTARSEIERKSQLISALNAEKDMLVLKSLQNRNSSFKRNFLSKSKNNLSNKGKEDESRFEKKDVTESQNLESDRRESVFSPKDDVIRSGTDSSTKENISHKRPNLEENKPRTIRNRRKSIPGFCMPAAKFSSDEEDAPFSGRNLPPKERDYPDRNPDRNFKPSIRTSEALDDRNTGNYERNRYHRNVESEKFRNHERTDFSQRHKRDGSPGRHRRRPRDTYDDHQRMEHDKYRRHDSPIDKFNQYPRRPRSNYDRGFQEQERFKPRNQDKYSKHKIPEFEEPKNKRFRPDTYSRYEEEKWSPEMQQMSEEFDKQYASCQSPDMNFLEPNPNHQIREIKLTANTQLDDPRKLSERYVVRKNEGKETITAVRGVDVDIAPLPLEKSSYDVKLIKIPEALKEKPVTDDLINEIYKDVDNPLLNDSMESGEILCDPDPQDTVPRFEIRESNTKEDSTKTDPNNQQPLANYRIPKLKICRSFTQSDNNTSSILSIKCNDDNNDNNMSDSKNGSKSVSKMDLDLKEVDLNVKDKAPISKQSCLPLLSSLNEKSNNEHIKTKAAMKMVEDDLELSDETCDTDTYKTKEKDIKTNRSSSDKRDHKTETKVTMSKAKCDSDDKNRDRKDVYITPDNEKKVKTKKRHNKQKNTSEEVKPKISPTVKPTKKKVKEKEVKTKEIKTKFSELFGDSSSLISPEDLGLIAVQPPLNQPVAGIFEDAQDAVDVNVKETTMNSETMVDTTVVEIKKTDDKKIEKGNKELSLEINSTDKVTDTNSALAQKNDVSIQSVYQNLEVEPKAEETNVKTVIISTGVQPTTTVFNKPILENLDQMEIPVKPPEQIGLKALATSTPLKLDVLNLPITNPKIIETNGNTNDIRNESTNNETTDTSISNIDSKTNEADVPDIRMFVKRRRKIIKK